MSSTAPAPDKSLEDLEKHILPLSEYYKTLDVIVKRRYLQKISVVGLDPATLVDGKLNSDCLPPIEALDLLSYLVLDTSYYTNDQFKNFKSLEAYNQLVSGFVTFVQGIKVSDKYVVIGKVRHSQRMNDPPLPVWIITADNGTILSAHCMGCKAGLGETCSHVASTLYYVECWTKVHGKLTCTQVKCEWLMPSYVSHVPYAPVSEINFKSARKLKQDLDEAIDANTPVRNNDCSPNPRTTLHNLHVPGISPTDAEINNLMGELDKCKVKPVCLSLVHPYANQFVLESRSISTVPDLYSSDNLDLSYPELLKKCEQTDLDITTEQMEVIERETREQSKGKSFFKHRAGRIGASVSGAVAHTNPTQPSQSLIKKICYPQLFNCSTKATEYGIKHEKDAVQAYEKLMQQKHSNFKVKGCGVLINKENPCLHATPDFLVECDCCGEGCGEAKCPVSIEGCDFEGYSNKKAACLELHNGKYMLKRTHHYYYQVQQQLHTSKKKYCDFVVFACDAKGNTAIFIERIFPDHAHWENVLPKLVTFWRYCILPEILGRWYTRKRHLSLAHLLTSDSVCYCRQERSGEPTVTCTNEDCPIKVFHCSCLAISIQDIPKTWHCPTCRTLFPKKRQGPAKTKGADNTKAMALDSICICNKKASLTDCLLECKGMDCPHGKFFHLQCLNYKRRPNNSTSWKCKNCKSKQVPNPLAKPVQIHPTPAAPVVNSPANDLVIDNDVDSDSDSEKPEIVKITTGTLNKQDRLAKLTNSDYDLILSPTGWLNCDIIQAAHVCLRKINPLIEGFQRPTLGPCRNFDVMTSEFVQILHTGHSHWVCVSSIDCVPGTISLYDSLSNDIISDEVQAQVESLVADNVTIECIPVQQQLNGYDCGVFAIAFASYLVHCSKPENFNFDIYRIRQHLYDCLKNDAITPFPCI